MSSRTGALILLAGLCGSSLTLADTATRQNYPSIQSSIDVDYEAAKKICDSLAGNARDICMAEAKGLKAVAQAELDFKASPSIDNRYKARAAKAEADYSIAAERCDDLAGNAKDVCVKEAKAAQVRAIAAAKAQLKTARADADAVDKTIAANAKATSVASTSHKEAAQDQRDAEYAVAKEKCDVLAGGAKETCLNEAKAAHGKK